MRVSSLILSLLLAVSVAFSHASYVGYSGAPGTAATCASSCHGSGTGTITVNGFPSNYIPGQAYTITVSRTGTTNIANFNASVRVGTGSTNAGVVSSGTTTSTYSVSNETNGVHFTTAQQSSGTFNWTAPASGTGTVRLYLAGHQGTSSGGPNNAFVFISDEAAVAPPAPQSVVLLADPPLARLYWPPVTGATGYNVYRTLSFEFPIVPGDLIGSTSDTSFVDSTVLSRPDLTAFYVVTATTP